MLFFLVPSSCHIHVVFSLFQSRILKHAGDLAAAAALADEARCMDLADRYINSECVKRMLQADQVLVFRGLFFLAAELSYVIWHWFGFYNSLCFLSWHWFEGDIG